MRPKLPTHVDQLSSAQFINFVRGSLGLEPLATHGRYYRARKEMKARARKRGAILPT